MAEAHCVYCKRESQKVPLITLTFGGEQFHICTQHLPILIHDPSRLVDKMPGAENLAAAEHHD